MRILIAEDDAALASFVRQGLQAEHYNGRRGRGWRAGARHGQRDRLRPGDSGSESAARRWRGRIAPSAPEAAHSAGAGAHPAQPGRRPGAMFSTPAPTIISRNRFSSAKLSARIRALLRRSHLPSESVLEVEGPEAGSPSNTAPSAAGRRIELTSKEFSLLEYLMRNAGRQVSRAMIIEHVWNLTFDTFNQRGGCLH